MAGVTAFSDDRDVPMRGFLHTTSCASEDCLILTHGAGGNCQSPLLVMLAETFAAAGVNVLRCDLPFRQKRPKGPPSPSSAERDQEGLQRAVELMRTRFGGHVFLGGQSYGGRQASLLAATEHMLVDGLLLLSYPLHPPGRPTQLRTAHFPEIRIPALFVHGSTDPFASSLELQSAVRLIPATTKVVEIEGAGHSLLTRQNREMLPAVVCRAFAEMFPK